MGFSSSALIMMVLSKDLMMFSMYMSLLVAGFVTIWISALAA